MVINAPVCKDLIWGKRLAEQVGWYHSVAVRPNHETIGFNDDLRSHQIRYFEHDTSVSRIFSLRCHLAHCERTGCNEPNVDLGLRAEPSAPRRYPAVNSFTAHGLRWPRGVRCRTRTRHKGDRPELRFEMLELQ